jgi:hypothetical protein
MVLGWREMKVASFGEDQLSLGAAAPPRAAMALLISAWREGKRRFGGWRCGGSGPSSSASVAASESESKSESEAVPLSPSSSASMMPSARR